MKVQPMTWNRKKLLAQTGAVSSTKISAHHPAETRSNHIGWTDGLRSAATAI
jgi:hypothetical protein